MARLSLSHVSKRFGNVPAVDDVSLEVADGEFLALLGPSGCGKTTILRMIAGFERVFGGEIAFDGETVSSGSHHLPPEKRKVGIVFQSYALWPHMTVAENVGYPLRVARVGADAYRRRVATAVETVGLVGFDERRPAELSGGQRQRVALARCLVMDTSLVLLDEPLASLDVHLRAAMESGFVEFHQKTRTTMIYITHDQSEAMALADRIAVMDAGRLVQVAGPEMLCREPATVMVANFIGQGVVVSATATAAPANGCCAVDLFGQEALLRCRPDQQPGPAKVSLRPESLTLAGGGIPGHVRRIVYRGGANDIEVTTDGPVQETLLLSHADAPEIGARVHIGVRDGWKALAASTFFAVLKMATGSEIALTPSRGADVFLGLSVPGVLAREDVKKMSKEPIVFAMANPLPEVSPEEVEDIVAVMATGRTDYPNQVNNVLAFPGIFRGALDARASEINAAMKRAAAEAIAAVIDADELSSEYIIPSVFNPKVAKDVATAVARAAHKTRVARRLRNTSIYRL